MGTAQIPSVDSDSKLFPASVLDALERHGLAAYSSLSRLRGGRFICAGDSLTATGEGRVPPAVTSVDSLASSIAALSKGRLWYDRVAGVPGNQSGQLLARIQADVIDHSPDICVVWIGTNDAGASIPLATYQSNMVGIVEALRAAGILAVICLVPPRADVSTAKTFVNAYNAWLQEWAPTQGVVLVDLYSALVDPATGRIAAPFDNGDQIHMKSRTYPVLAQLIVDGVTPSLGAATSYLAKDAVDPTDLLGGSGLFLGTPTNGLPAGWGSGDTAHLKFSVTPTDVGNALTITATGDVGYQVQAYQYVNAGFGPGDTVEVAGVMTSVASAGHVAGVVVSVNGSSAPDLTSIAVQSGIDRVGGSFRLRFVVPAGTTDLLVRLMAGPSAGAVTFKQLRARNLSALGLA
jgi:lysophospholipase L1-like esterase